MEINPVFRFISVMRLSFILILEISSFLISLKCDTGVINIIVLAPLNPSQRMFSLRKIGPGVQIGIEEVRHRQILGNMNISVKFVDTNFSSRIAPIRAMQLMERRQAHLFLGPVYDYSLAPVARYAPHWVVPIITPGGFAHDFKANRAREYETLTRIGPAFESTADFIGKIIQANEWSRAILIYQGDGQRFVFPRFCFLAASAYIYHFQRDRYKHIAKHDFHIYLRNKESYESLLRNRIGEKYSGKLYVPEVVWIYLNINF